MSKREDITARIYDLLKTQRNIKLGVVSRDPIIAEELPRTGFPSVMITSTDEERERIATGVTESVLEVELVLNVNGADRDRQRNLLAEAIGDTIAADTDLGALVSDIRVARIENIENGEAAPYASMRVVFETRYCL